MKSVDWNINQDLEEILNGARKAFKSLDGANIFLTGGTRRGPLNAVIALLTEDAGCRWYSSDSPPAVPRKNAISLTPRWYVPKLKTRELLYKEAFNSEWAFFNRLTPSFSRFSSIPKKYGVRIEDDVLITKSGIEILTKNPKTF